MYEFCFFCPATGEARRKLMPFGNREDAKILVILPNFSPLTPEQEAELAAQYSEAMFVYFVACKGLDDHVEAELPCSVLLRNFSAHYSKVLAFPSPKLQEMFGVGEGIFLRSDGVKVGVYKGSVLDKGFNEEFVRLSNG